MFELQISALFRYKALSFPARMKHLILRALVNQAQFVEKPIKHLPVQCDNRTNSKGVKYMFKVNNKDIRRKSLTQF